MRGGGGGGGITRIKKNRFKTSYSSVDRNTFLIYWFLISDNEGFGKTFQNKKVARLKHDVSAMTCHTFLFKTGKTGNKTSFESRLF